MLKEPKRIGKCLRTSNGYGLSFEHLNSFGKKLLTLANTDKPVMDIGAGYGAFCLEALEKGFQVIANDLSSDHLDYIKTVASEKKQLQSSHLQTHVGRFPEEIHLTPESLGAIYTCGVMHYFTPSEFVDALQKMRDLLDQDGYLCIVTSSPYLKGYESFLPIFEERLKNNVDWPGVIDNYQDYFSSDDFENPESTHLMDCQVLEKAVTQAGFKTLKCDYLSVKNDYEKQYTCGKELSAIIAQKI